MALYIDKSMVDGVEELPRLTQEEFEAIPVAERPKIWVKRNATETDRGITAEDVQYSSTQNAKQKIDEVNSSVKIKNYVSLSKSDFDWDDTFKAFISKQTIRTIIGTKSLLGFSAWFTNGGAIANARYNGNNQKIHIEGWIPTVGAVVNSNYDFTVVIYTD